MFSGGAADFDKLRILGYPGSSLDHCKLTAMSMSLGYILVAVVAGVASPPWAPYRRLVRKIPAYSLVRSTLLSYMSLPHPSLPLPVPHVFC